MKIILLIVPAFLLNDIAFTQTTSPGESAAITKNALDYIALPCVDSNRPSDR
jgi:hypothetical protein